jgi:hypothetical protein
MHVIALIVQHFKRKNKQSLLKRFKKHENIVISLFNRFYASIVHILLILNRDATCINYLNIKLWKTVRFRK